MTVVGYNHKLGVLLDTIVDMIMKFEVREDRFAVIKVRCFFLFKVLLCV